VPTRLCTWYVRILCRNNVWVTHSVAVELHVAVSRALREAMGKTDGALAPARGETVSIDVRWIGEQPSLIAMLAEKRAPVELVRPWESAPGLDDQEQIMP
jgi:hypothetical protein